MWKPDIEAPLLTLVGHTRTQETSAEFKTAWILVTDGMVTLVWMRWWNKSLLVIVILNELMARFRRARHHLHTVVMTVIRLKTLESSFTKTDRDSYQKSPFQKIYSIPLDRIFTQASTFWWMRLMANHLLLKLMQLNELTFSVFHEDGVPTATSLARWFLLSLG